MQTVIIVDDEKKICRLLLNLIDWNSLGYEIIATANNGLDAFELIERYKPNLVITDIRMPGLDGIEMIKKTTDILPDVKFIIISGFAQFEYAHSAIKYGVEHYLLKPIDEKELSETLVKIRQQYLEKVDVQSSQERLSNELAHNRDKVRASLLNNILLNPDFIISKDMGEINKEYSCHFVPGVFRIIILKCDKKFRSNIPRDEILLNKLLDLFITTYAESTAEMICCISDFDILCLLNYDQQMHDQINKCHKILFKETSNFSDIFGSSFITIGLGSLENNIADILNSFNSAVFCIRRRVILGNDKIIDHANQTLQVHVNIDDIITYQKEQNLRQFIESNNQHEVSQWFQDIYTEISNNKQFDSISLISLVDKIIDLITVFYINITENQKDIAHLIYELKIKLYNAKSLDELFNVLSNGVISIFNDYFSSNVDRKTKMIQTVKQYIDENYQNPLKLQDVADFMHFNSSYFSIIFKQQVGSTFSDYLLNVRINAAKKLLRSTDLNILDIAKHIGYSDSKNFSKLFNRVVGVKPSEYRHLYSK